MLHKPKTTTQEKKLAENLDGHVRSANSGCFKWMMVQWRRQKRIVNETLQRARRGRDEIAGDKGYVHWKKNIQTTDFKFFEFLLKLQVLL